MTDERKKVVEAKARFMEVCSKWADGLIADGVLIGRNVPLQERADHFTLPKTYYTDHEGTIHGSDLPNEQAKVWTAAYQLIYDVRDATEYEPQRADTGYRVDDFK